MTVKGMSGHPASNPSLLNLIQLYAGNGGVLRKVPARDVQVGKTWR